MVQLKLNNFLHHFVAQPKAIAPLVTFRILFGGLMAFGGIRFVQNGWIEKLYLEPSFFFKYYGFEWVEALGQTGMYFVFALIIVSAIMIALGFLYKLATVVFFLSFSYVELIDATNYLNHYYLVCLLAFLLILLPAHRAFSLDVKLGLTQAKTHIPAWCINILIFQFCVVYTFAGIAKLNSEWLFRAMPMAIWLPERSNIPVLGYFFSFKWVAYFFSWAGAFYDLSISYFLLHKFSRPIAYFFVVVFHLLTKLLFNIGLFPFIMIFGTLIFFSAPFHQKLLGLIGYNVTQETKHLPFKFKSIVVPFLGLYIAFQVLFPLRHWLYPSDVLWSEEGYRFAWRVMLVEKNGRAIFEVSDTKSNRKSEIINAYHLTDFQEKQMAIQPDFILQYAHYLAQIHQEKYGIDKPSVHAKVNVALNGRSSQVLIEPTVDLSTLNDGLHHKKWILDYK